MRLCISASAFSCLPNSSSSFQLFPSPSSSLNLLPGLLFIDQLVSLSFFSPCNPPGSVLFFFNVLHLNLLGSTAFNGTCILGRKCIKIRKPSDVLLSCFSVTLQLSAKQVCVFCCPRRLPQSLLQNKQSPLIFQSTFLSSDDRLSLLLSTDYRLLRGSGFPPCLLVMCAIPDLQFDANSASLLLMLLTLTIKSRAPYHCPVNSGKFAGYQLLILLSSPSLAFRLCFHIRLI